MANLFQTGDGEGETLAVFSFTAPSDEWFRRAVTQMLSLACNPDNWTQQGDASIAFATDKAVQALNSLTIEEI
jgi:hypothetical protein